MVVADRYRLEEQLGEGAFGFVFRARDQKLDRLVALKILNRDSVDAAGVERFRREAELARKLEHPNTVPLLDFDLEAEPAPYIAYELLEGQTLEKLLAREGGMSESRVAEVAARVLSSLLEAHNTGIVHRDIKPGNIFVTSGAGGTGWIRVLDFGIAKSTGGKEVALTAAGILIGTPRYMPPEQIRGEPPSAGMDLYALGMMMAEMLTGQPLLRCSAVEACLEQLRPERIELPNRVVRSGLGDIILRATDKDPVRRYATAQEMLDDLEAVSTSLASVPPGPPSAPPPAGDAADRASLAPTEVMKNPEGTRLPAGVAPAAAESSGVGWAVLSVALLLLAMAATAFGVYAWRTAQQETSAPGVRP